MKREDVINMTLALKKVLQPKLDVLNQRCTALERENASLRERLDAGAPAATPPGKGRPGIASRH